MNTDRLSQQQAVKLIGEACASQKRAYAPYSHFQVGAALLTKEGQIFTGCNIENAAYSPTNCAERTAVFKAVSEGVRAFAAIAIVGGMEGREPTDLTAPCGVCRQVFMEFCEPKEFRILLGKGDKTWEEYTLEELLPLGFSGKNLEMPEEERDRNHA